MAGNQMFHEVTLTGSHHGRPFSIDIHWENTDSPKPVVLLIHGFKGFKDWGTFPTIARWFASAGYVFVKMNLSHNGVTPSHPEDFVDLEAFSENTFTMELQDVDDVISFLMSAESPVPATEMTTDGISLIGHSRGGSIAYIKARTDSRIRSVTGWAAVCDLENRWPESMLMEWREKGIYYLPNSRTGQLMPLRYNIAEDYIANQEKYHVPTALGSLKIPALQIHGSMDETVFLDEVKMVLKKHPHISLHIIEGANHTFGGSHPFNSDNLPEHTRDLIQKTEIFLRSV